ncbi:MAG: transcription factor IIB [Cenarchaeum symbiont of Oopsacas minuta]|nr:transcription factor IIB [Cenarchaeum symbiont of Oopsacas minuta]
MNNKNTINCPECSSKLLDDVHNGEIVCSGCGVVVEEQTADYGPEYISTDPGERMKLARATGHTTFSQHDYGISTNISMETKDFSGKSINTTMSSKMKSLRTWQDRIRVSTPKERRLVSVLAKINGACDSMSLPPNIRETASAIYRSLGDKIEVKGKSVICMSAAVIFTACRQCGTIRSIEEICKSMCEPKDVKAKSKLSTKYYRNMVIEFGSTMAPSASINTYISRIANVTKIDSRVERTALDIADKMGKDGIMDGKAPNGIAAAYLYIATNLLGHKMVQREISNTAEITEVTIRSRCKEMLEHNRLQITLQPA